MIDSKYKVYPLNNEQLWEIIHLRNEELEELSISLPEDWYLFAEKLHKRFSTKTRDYIDSTR